MLSRKFSIIPDLTFRQLYNHLYRNFTKHQPLQCFNRSFPCVFVLSTGRVGSETLATLYKLANCVLSYHEPTPKLFGLSKLAYRYYKHPVGQTILQEALLTARRELFNYSLSCRKGYIETSPQATFLAPIILHTISNVRFIHLVRDPHDVVRSGMRRQWYNGNRLDITRIIPEPESKDSRLWNNYTTFQKNLWLWNETNRWILDFSADVPAQQKLLIRSEDIFGAHQETIEALFSFIGTELPSQKKIANILRKKLNAQKVGDFPKTSAWTEEMHQALETMTGETARRLGYTV